MDSIYFDTNSSTLNNTIMSNSNQAVEIAVDAHATRLIQSNSAPEACVDSSLGPYITSILREALLTNNINSDTTSLSSIPEYDSLIELLESQCQMELHVAESIIADIALAIRTNGIPDQNNGQNNNSTESSALSCPERRSRSKSLGAEPAKDLDVDFLGRILQESMKQQNPSVENGVDHGLDLTHNGCTAPPQSMSNDFSFLPPITSVFVNNNGGSALLSKDRQQRNQRHVSFDETYTTTIDNGPQCREPYNYNSPMNSWNTAGNDVNDAQACLGASLGFLDLEEDEEGNITNQMTIKEECEVTEDESRQDEKRGTAVTNGTSTLEVINSELAQCHPVSGFPDLPPAENTQESGINSSDKPPTNPKRPKKRASKKEAEELVAALFVTNSRPRSNSLPLSVNSGTPNYAYPSINGVPNSKSSTSLCTTETSATTQSTDNNSAVIESTTEILLTMNYHLGHEAASLASQLSYGDLNLAQYLIEAARSINAGGYGFNSYNRRRSRICRHELQGTCYRHDCPYSHDIAGVTCLFWLKGRCHHSDGSSCRFMHGFAESLLEGVNEDYLKEQQMKKEQEKLQVEEEKRNQAAFVPTTNLLQHNEWSVDKNYTSPVFGSSLWSSPSLENR